MLIRTISSDILTGEVRANVLIILLVLLGVGLDQGGGGGQDLVERETHLDQLGWCRSLVICK